MFVNTLNEQYGPFLSICIWESISKTLRKSFNWPLMVSLFNLNMLLFDNELTQTVHPLMM